MKNFKEKLKTHIHRFLFGVDFEYYQIDDEVSRPVYNEDNFGIDLYVRRDTLIPANFEKPVIVPLNIILKGNIRRNALLFPRSSFPKGKCILGNSVGVIDSKYEGIKDEIGALVFNVSNEDVLIKRGQRICQLVFVPRFFVNNMIIHKDHWNCICRGGFGSTGKY